MAPHGYVARTNFSFTGDVNEGLGQVRYLIEEGLLMPGSGMGLFTPQWILTDVARCFENPIMGIDLRSGDFNKPRTNGWFIDYDFISRRGSTSSAVVQGVRPGENPELSVMWTILGYPPTGVAMPLWVKGADKYLPALVARDEATKLSPLCDFSQTLADRVYSYHQGDGTDRYMNWELLWRPSGGGYMQQLLEVEDQVFDVSEPIIDGWREAGRIDVGQMSELYLMLDGLIRDGYRPLLGSHPLL